ncbi:MAG: GTP-binding protein [Limnothrix sp. RL_2_0]|nr:GTP-binding protein [Limnothrix sp. RL_2_0]
MAAAEVLALIEQAAAEGWTELDLSGKRLTEIPKAIFQLKKIKKLSLFANQIKTIPEEIAKLENLTYLSLSGNKIKEIPSIIAKLHNLEKLYLYSNEIQEIPESISSLSNLEVFNFSRNQIKKIPIKIFELSKLKVIRFSQNPISFPYNIPIELTHSSNSRIFNYLREIYLKDHRPLHEAKMLLVGQGSVGKTSLIERLINDHYDQNQPQTDGLSVKDWQIHVNSKDIRLNVWDFGGQEIYHATHQFFLTKRSLYILVCNCRTSEEENRIEYWLKLIQTFGDASPVIIVGNKKDEQPLDINRKALREKYPNICAIGETSCQTGEGIKELSNAIHQEVGKLKEVYDLLPLPWFEVKEQLEAMTNDFISYNRYINICCQNNISEEQNQDQLIDLLHRLGLVLNFREHPLLQQTNVLKPEWATEGIYALLSDETLKTDSKGIFSCDDLTRILDPERYPTERHQYLIELMKEFKLCFALDCNPPQFLIPGILPKDEPEETDLDGDTLEFQYHYRVLPDSVISRFIVMTHEKIHENIWWRSGVMLEYKEGSETCNIARIKADPEDNKIFITINGKPETRRTFLGILRDVFKKLHQAPANLEITEWVPVPKHPKHPPLDYQELLGLEAMGEDKVTIGKLKLKLDLRQLLDGYESIQQRQKAQNEAARIDKQYNFYGDVKDPDFIGGSKMTGDQPNVSINADNIGIASMSGGKIESGAIVAGQYNEASNDLEDLLQLLTVMKEAVQFFPQEQQEDITIDIDDIEAEVKKPKDKRRIPKIKKCLTALATAGTVAIAALSATNTATVQLTEFVDNASTLANKFNIELAIPAPTQNQTLPPAP